MRTLLLCGYKTSNEKPLGLETLSNGEGLIDHQISRLQQLGFEPVCVLSGLHADEALRVNHKIAACELVFDTNEATNLISNIKAGLRGTDGEGCFVLPLEIPCPEATVWWRIKDEWRRIGFHTSVSLLQTVTDDGSLWQRGFPLLITRNGNKQLRALPELTSLTDPRLEYLHLALSPGPELASSANPL